jgi:hypothetical protein
MPLTISGVDFTVGLAGAGGVSEPSPPTIAPPPRDVLRRYTHASVRFFTLPALICFSVL